MQPDYDSEPPLLPMAGYYLSEIARFRGCNNKQHWTLFVQNDENPSIPLSPFQTSSREPRDIGDSGRLR